MGKGYKYVVCMLMCLLVFSSCSRKSIPVESIVVHDTIEVVKTTQLRDTVIISPSAKVDLQLPCPDLNITAQQVKNKQAKLSVTPIQSGVQIDCECDTLGIVAQMKDTFTNTHQKSETVKTVVVKEKYIPKWVKILAIVGASSVLSLGFVIIRKVV